MSDLRGFCGWFDCFFLRHEIGSPLESILTTVNPSRLQPPLSAKDQAKSSIHKNFFKSTRGAWLILKEMRIWVEYCFNSLQIAKRDHDLNDSISGIWCLCVGALGRHKIFNFQFLTQENMMVRIYFLPTLEIPFVYNLKPLMDYVLSCLDMDRQKHSKEYDCYQYFKQCAFF